MPERHLIYGRNWGGPYVPAQTILALLDMRVPEGQIWDQLTRAQVSTKLPELIRSGAKEWITLDVADRIICRVLGDGSLWHRVPELAAVYEAD